MSRVEREHQLRELWKSRQGQYRVLQMYWECRPDGTAMQSGECVFDAILEREFGPSDDA